MDYLLYLEKRKIEEMKKLSLYVFLGLLLSSNAYAGNYAKFLKKYEKRGSYVVMAKSISKGKVWWTARPSSYDDAANIAISKCNTRFQVNDCVLSMVSDRSVFEESKQDYQIQSAQSICKKIGLTAGTDKFTDCIIKMMSQAQVQGQSQGGSTVIYGQRPYNKSVCAASGGLLC